MDILFNAKSADITSLHVDAIVNAANNSLGDGAGVNGAIQQAAGPELLEYCKTLGGCDTGQAKLTPGFKLPAKYIIHTVGPVWQDGVNNEQQLLTSCYQECLSIASKKSSITSIAFPAISTGIFGFPPVDAAQIAVKTCKDHAENIQQVIFCCFDQETLDLYNRLLSTD